MNWLFRRHFWVLHMVFLAIVAMISAKTFTTLTGYYISKLIPNRPLVQPFRESDEPKVVRDFSIVNERNLFDAKREQISFAQVEPDEQLNTGRWQDAQLSALPLKLISTMVFSDPFSSRATIEDVSSGSAREFSIGECEPYKKAYDPDVVETVLPPKDWEPARPCSDVFGMASLVRIEEFRVYIFNERDKKYEFLSLLAEEKMPPRKRPQLSAVEEEGIGVRKVGATSYEIDQSEFDRALSNVARLMTEARAVPESDGNGNYVGFKIIYLKEGSLFEKIGIERMDVLTRINGYELNSPEKALQLFSKLRSAHQFTIDLLRGGRSVTLDYSVVR